MTNAGVTAIGDLKKNKKLLTQHQKIGLRYFKELSKRIPRDEIRKIEKIINKHLKTLNKGVKGQNKYKAVICGSYRRGLPTSGDIDVLLTHGGHTSKHKNGGPILKRLVDALKRSNLVTHTLSHGRAKFMGVCRLDKGLHRRLDLRLIPQDQFYCGVLYYTGSDQFNKAMRAHALKNGFTLNEYNLRPITKDRKPLNPIVIKSEKDVFKRLSFPWRSPANRNW